MKFLCVLLSLLLCCWMVAFASPVSDGAVVPGDVSNAPFDGFQGERPMMPIDGEFPQDESRRPNFSDMAEGGFQPPHGGDFPAFGGRDNPWQQNAENQTEENGLSLFLKEYSIVLVSLGVLAVAFIFVGLYRRRHY